MIAEQQATDRRAWLQRRLLGLGSSDAAAIAGLDPYRGPMSVWLSKTGRLPLEAEGSEWMKWGRLLEPAMADEFQRLTGLFVGARQLLVENPERPWQIATLDGFVYESSDEDAEAIGIYEAKTVAGFKSGAWAEEVPEHFQIQVQHQLAVTGLEHAWLAVLFGGQRMEIFELERDEDVIYALIALEEAFWTYNVLGDVAPAADGSVAASEDLRRAFAASNASTIDLPDEVEGLILQRTAAQEWIRAGEESRAKAEQGLMTLMREAEVGLVAGKPRVTWKKQERKEHVVKASSYRVLRVVGKAGDEGE